ncbi:unnamed protein product, partial [Didymodactylos carnosus]
YPTEDRQPTLPTTLECHFVHPHVTQITADLYLMKNIIPFEEQKNNEFVESDARLRTIKRHLNRQEENNKFRSI